MLTKYRLQGKLRAIHAPRNAPPRILIHERSQKRIRTQALLDGYRVRIEVQEPPATLDRRTQIPHVL